MVKFPAQQKLICLHTPLNPTMLSGAIIKVVMTGQYNIPSNSHSLLYHPLYCVTFYATKYYKIKKQTEK